MAEPRNFQDDKINMEMGTVKPTPEPLVDEDLEKMSRDELITAILRWRKMAPMIKDVCHELADFRQIAPNPAELKAYIDNTTSVYKETIKQQQSQIHEMQQAIEDLVEDPLQIEERLNQHLGKSSKKRLN